MAPAAPKATAPARNVVSPDVHGLHVVAPCAGCDCAMPMETYGASMLLFLPHGNVAPKRAPIASAMANHHSASELATWLGVRLKRFAREPALEGDEHGTSEGA